MITSSPCIAHQHQTSALQRLPRFLADLCATAHAEANHCAETWDTSLQSVFSNLSTELRSTYTIFFWKFSNAVIFVVCPYHCPQNYIVFSEIFTCGDLRCLSVSLSVSVLGRLQRTKNLCVVSEWVSGGNKSSARASLSAPPTLLNWNHFSSMHYDFFVAISIGCHTYHSCIQGCTNTLKIGHVHAPHASAGISEDDWKSLPHLPYPYGCVRVLPASIDQPVLRPLVFVFFCQDANCGKYVFPAWFGQDRNRCPYMNE